MAREVKIGKMLFIVNSFSNETAKETAEQMLKRVIIKNAEREFKNAGTTVKTGKGTI